MSAAERIPAQAFGPGFLGTGSAVEVELSDYGLRLVTEDGFDGHPPWTDVAARKGGFNDRALLLEWTGRAGRYALSLSDPAAIAAVRARLAATQPQRQIAGSGIMGRGGATRAWSHAFIWGTIVVPLILIGALVWQHERIAAWAVSLIPVAQERKLGEAVFAQAKTRLTLVDGPATTMVREIGARLSQGSVYAYEFHVANDPSVNAFAIPGGFIVIHSGLIASAASAEEVAGVIAHEIVHVEKRHSLKAMAKGAGVAIAVALVTGDLGGVAVIGTELANLSFSRGHETEADLEGLKLLVKAGIAPHGMRDFFRKLGDGTIRTPGWLSSHPPSAERYTALDAAIKALPPSSHQPLGYDLAAIKASLPAAKPAAPKETK
ncbi:MAG: M48 family metallopeptidase [Burkholderiales bacterium]|nr:M48 family metallopeptidase [Burkholderiales bacterium]